MFHPINPMVLGRSDDNIHVLSLGAENFDEM